MDLKILFLVFSICFVISVVHAQKQGDCPPPTQVGICAMTCNSDQQCSGIAKCCRTMCGGTICTRPVTRVQNKVRVKPGNCPATPKGPWVCSSRCANDGDCRGSTKCCKNRCGALECQKPE